MASNSSDDDGIEWHEGWHEAHKRYFYFNKRTQESVWGKPDAPYVPHVPDDSESEEENEDEDDEDACQILPPCRGAKLPTEFIIKGERLTTLIGLGDDVPAAAIDFVHSHGLSESLLHTIKRELWKTQLELSRRFIAYRETTSFKTSEPRRLLNPGDLNANMNPAPGVEEDFEAHAAVVGDRPAGCYVVGEFVDVLDTVGKWCEGQIKEVDPVARSVSVTYLYWGDGFDEVFPFGSTRLAPEGSQVYVPGGQGGLRLNHRIEVRDTMGQWIEAEVIAVYPQAVRIHYHNWDAKWDEDLPKDSGRIRAYGRNKMLRKKRGGGIELCGIAHGTCIDTGAGGGGGVASPQQLPRPRVPAAPRAASAASVSAASSPPFHHHRHHQQQQQQPRRHQPTWTCSTCTLINDVDHGRCTACGERAPEDARTQHSLLVVDEEKQQEGGSETRKNRRQEQQRQERQDQSRRPPPQLHDDLARQGSEWSRTEEALRDELILLQRRVLQLEAAAATAAAERSALRVGAATAQPEEQECVVCMDQPRSAILVHGSDGHQVCCVDCARRLKRDKKPCPVCQRPIESVLRHFS